MKPIMFSLLKLVGIGIFVLIFLHIDLHEIIENLQGASLASIILSYGFIVLLYAIKTLRWHVLVSSVTSAYTYSDSWKLYNIGIFLSIITPAKIGEFGKAAFLKAKGVPTLTGLSLSLLDRLCDVVVIAILSLAAIGILWSWHVTAWFTGALLILLVIGAFVLQKIAALPRLAFLTSLKKPRVLLYAFSLTLLGWVVYFLWALTLASAVGVHISPIIMIAVFTATGILSLLPIAPSGLGTRDIALITLLLPYGVAPALSESLALLMFVMILLSSIPGLLYWIAQKKL